MPMRCPPQLACGPTFKDERPHKLPTAYFQLFTFYTTDHFISSQDNCASKSPACRTPPRLHPGDLARFFTTAVRWLHLALHGLHHHRSSPGQTPRWGGGSLMPRFKCKFRGHSRPTTTLELLNGGGGDSADDVSLSPGSLSS